MGPTLRFSSIGGTTFWPLVHSFMADKTADDVAPAGVAGHAPLQGTVAAHRGRSASRIIAWPAMSSGDPARTPVSSVVPGRYRQGAGRPKLVGA